MSLKTLNREQSFDTLKLKVPSKVFHNINWNKFNLVLKQNAGTGIIHDADGDENLFPEIEKIKGLNSFTYVPNYDLFDLQISSKILGEDYYRGITKNTITKVAETLISNELVSDVNLRDFVTDSQVLRGDNTFNIEVKEKQVQDYYDSLSLIITQGHKGKINIYDDGKDKVNGIVIGKDTKILQKLTIYDKMDEARVLLKSQSGLNNFDELLKKEYGMEGKDFREYFENKLRIELRVNDFGKLRKFYTNRPKGDVFLYDLLFSENNAILYQWNQFVSSTNTKTAIKFLDMSYNDKMNYKLENWSSVTNWNYLKPFIEKFNGDEKVITEKIQKLHYYDNQKQKYRKMGKSVENDIIRFCSEWKQNKLKQLRGTLYPNSLTEKFKEVEKKIHDL